MALIKTRLNNFNKGLNKDTPINLLLDDECAELLDVVHRSKVWTQRPGFTLPYTDTGGAFPTIEIADYVEAGVSTLIRGHKDGVDYLNGTTWVNRLNLGTTRTDKDKIFFAEGGGYSWFTNGVDPIHRSTNPSSTNYTSVSADWVTTTVGGSAGCQITRADIIFFFNNRLWMANVTDSVDGLVGNRLRFTNVNAYGASNLRCEGTTGRYDFDDTQSDIISAGVLLNNAMALFKEDMVGIVQNTGNPIVSPALRFSPGIIAPKAWTYIPGGGMFYISKTGFHMFQGGLPEEVGRNKVRSYFFSIVDEANLDNIYCWTNWKDTEIVIHIPTTSGVPTKCLIYNWSTGAWSEWDYQAYCGFYRHRLQTSTKIYFGHDSGNVRLSGGSTDNGTPIVTRLTTKAFSTLAPDRNSAQNAPNYIQINRIWTDARPVGSTVYIGEADYGRETPTYNNSATITEVDGLQPVADLQPTSTAYATIKITGFTKLGEIILEWTGAGDI